MADLPRAAIAAPIYGPLKPVTWPQGTLAVPKAPTGSMPPIQRENREIARREAFTMSGTINMPNGTLRGQQFYLSLPTDQDGDFWCDQIAMTAWNTTLVPQVNELPPPALLQIADARTGKQLWYPEGISTEFLATVVVFQDKPVLDFSTSPLPDGFRSTSTLPQAFCFTRQGAIQVILSALYAWPSGGNAYTVDLAFSGWKEYEHASA